MPTLKRIETANNIKLSALSNNVFKHFFQLLQKGKINLAEYDEIVYTLAGFFTKKENDFAKSNKFVTKEQIQEELKKLLEAKKIILSI